MMAATQAVPTRVHLHQLVAIRPPVVDEHVRVAFPTLREGPLRGDWLAAVVVALDAEAETVSVNTPDFALDAARTFPAGYVGTAIRPQVAGDGTPEWGY